MEGVCQGQQKVGRGQQEVWLGRRRWGRGEQVEGAADVTCSAAAAESWSCTGSI